MKKNYFVVLVMVIVMICSSMSFATVFDNTNQAEVVMPTTEPAEHTSNGIISSQFNYDEKFTHMFINGCYLECPRNMKSANGTISIRKCTVTEPNIAQDYKARFYFDFIGPNSIYEYFYIRAYDANGVKIDEHQYRTDYDQDYNPKKQKYTYRSLLADAVYFVPFEAVRVVVENDFQQ